MPKIQVLVATMYQDDHSLLEKMNIRSDAIIGNQCDKNSIEYFNWNNHKITYLNFAERGVGLNRNNTLMRAENNICLFADDDMVYEDNYVDVVLKAFDSYTDADVIIFNLKESNSTRYIIKKTVKVNRFNFLRYGAPRIAIKLNSIKKHAIYFNQCFGGGTDHCAGEDNLFLAACIKQKLKIYAVPLYIATLTNNRESTWFTGYDNKYLQDKGYLFYIISKRWWHFMCFQDAIRHQKRYTMSWYTAYKQMLIGKEIKSIDN